MRLSENQSRLIVIMREDVLIETSEGNEKDGRKRIGLEISPKVHIA